MITSSCEIVSKGISEIPKLGVVGGLLVILTLVAAGCNDESHPNASSDPLNTQTPANAPPASSPESPTGLHFPQMREDQDAMNALLVGELVIENDCLRVKSMDGADHLLIWPKRFDLTVDGEDVRISGDSGVSLSVGEEIGFGGGEMPLDHLQTLVLMPVPNDCAAPYWVIGEVSVNPEAQE